MSKSVAWHKEKLLARLHPADKNVITSIVEVPAMGLYLMLHCKWIQKLSGKEKEITFKKLLISPKYHRVSTITNRMRTRTRARNVQIEQNNVVLRAIHELVDAGILVTDISNQEWSAQIALGVAKKRTYELAIKSI